MGLEAYRVVTVTGAAAWRVHPAPAALPKITFEGPGRNRFDDPYMRWAVRYAAETVRGCLVETMARFRPDPSTETLLFDVAGVTDDDVSHDDPMDALAEWLSMQKVGRLRATQPLALLDVETPELLVAMDKHPLVRVALENSGLGTKLSPVRLDTALVRLGGPVGRPITQALAGAIREWEPDAGGLVYPSRLDSQERCFALWDDAEVIVEVAPLDAGSPEHRAAVQSVAKLFEIPLPALWG